MCNLLFFRYLFVVTSLSFFLTSFMHADDDSEIKGKLAQGNVDSSIEIYVISDWYCPSCKKAEPKIEQIFKDLKSKAVFYFIDDPINRQSVNFTPYHLAFITNEKQKYIEARAVLLELTKSNQVPKDEDVVKAAKKKGLTLKKLSFVEIKNGTRFFDDVVKRYKITATPAIVIVNKETGKSEILKGVSQINKTKAKEAVEKLK